MSSISQSYPSKIYTVFSYIKNTENEQKNRSTIMRDTIKCMAIGAGLAGILRYTRG